MIIFGAFRSRHVQHFKCAWTVDACELWLHVNCGCAVVVVVLAEPVAALVNVVGCRCYCDCAQKTGLRKKTQTLTSSSLRVGWKNDPKLSDCDKQRAYVAPFINTKIKSNLCKSYSSTCDFGVLAFSLHKLRVGNGMLAIGCLFFNRSINQFLLWPKSFFTPFFVVGLVFFSFVRLVVTGEQLIRKYSFESPATSIFDALIGRHMLRAEYFP